MAAAQIVAIDTGIESQMTNAEKNALGRICFWDGSGDTVLSALSDALVGTGVDAPKAVTAKVAVHRAMLTVARGAKLRLLHHRKAHMWLIVDEPLIDGEDAEGEVREGSKLEYRVRTQAHVTGGLLEVHGEHAQDVRAAFDVELNRLAPVDVSAWLIDTVCKMGGVSLRAGDGFYFLPQPLVAKWERIKAAVEQSTRFKLHGIPSMRGQDAIAAVLEALTRDTRKQCEDIEAKLADLGRRGLETRADETSAMLSRVEQYEELLGSRLDDLRAAIDDTNRAVAAAQIGLGGQE